MARFGSGSIALVTAALLGFTACSSDESGRRSTGATGGSPSGGEAPVGGSTAAGTGASAGTAGGGPSCLRDRVTAERVPLDIFAMLDASDSMLLLTGSRTSKWTAVAEALASFARDPGSAGIGFGLGYYPVALEDVPETCTDDEACGAGAPCISKICLNDLLELDRMRPCAADGDCDMGTGFPPTCMTIGDCSTEPEAICFTESTTLCQGGTCTPSGICSRFVSCDDGHYATPAVPIAPLPGVEAALLAALRQREPADRTPTVPALAGALEHASTWAESHPDHDVVSLLVMGGLPNECFESPMAGEAEALEQLVELARDGAGNGIRTFVIGLLTANEIAAGAQDALDGVADAGKTEQSFIVDSGGNVDTELAAVLHQIRRAEWGCEFRVPDAIAGDYDELNLDFSFASMTLRIPQVEDASACDSTSGGWHYDVDPGSGDPQRIIACPSSCSILTANATGTAAFELGCDSETL
jgi:hypothetical protein